MGRVIRRALVGAAVIALLACGAVAADSLRGDSDTLTAGVQSSRDLGNVVVGSVLDVPVGFVLTCANSAHVDVGQSVTVGLASAGVPAGGSATFDPVTVGPVPAGWPADGSSCTSALSLSAAGMVRLTAPSAPGGPHTYSLMFGRSLAPVGTGDASAVNTNAFVDLVMTVVPNTPPALTLPADMTVEGSTTGGAAVTFAATAADAEDDPDPAVACTPASGGFFAMGSTTVSCSATDSAGATASGSFGVTVVDTTAPALQGVPADISVVAADPSGAVATFAAPTAADVVDPAPVVACAPVSGSLFALGTTTVGCTATDASGNAATATFTVTVDAPPPPAPPPPPVPSVTVAFDPPVGPDGTLRVNGQRTVPVKARVLSGGTDLGTGGAALVASACEGTSALATPLWVPTSWQPGAARWMGLLPTGALPAGCFRIELVLTTGAGDVATSGASGTAAGSFTLWVDPPPSKGPTSR
jgi:hypothetical protein